MAADEAPACCGRPMRPIVYGYPSGEMFEAAERDEITLGGCVIDEGIPRWSCPRCGRTAGTLDDLDAHLADDDW